MRYAAGFLLLVPFLLPVPAQSADETLRVELNALESAPGRCRFSFVTENLSDTALDTLKLDLAVFNKENIVQRRLVTELGPLRAKKTMLRAFEVEGECGQIGAVLLNDVTACAPLETSTCLDQLGVSSRVEGVRLYK